MLEYYFTRPCVLRKLREAAAGALLDRLAAQLRAAEYTRNCAQQILCTAAHFIEWSRGHGAAVAELDDRHLARFEEHLDVCTCSRGRRHRVEVQLHGARMVLDHVRGRSVMRRVSETAAPMPPLVAAFDEWMRGQCGLADASRGSYRLYVLRFVVAAGDDPKGYTAGAVRAFVLQQAEGGTRSRAQAAAKALRLFLRYLAIHGRCPADLIAAVPKIAHWRLAALPQGLPADSVNKIIATADPATRLGSRDRAILLLLARLGLRLGDIVSLRTGDIDWARGRLRVAGKGRRESWLPLVQEVGDALLAYLAHPRAIQSDRVFLRESTVAGPLGRGGVKFVVSQAIRRAGIKGTPRGAHILRHSFASDALRQGASLDLVSRLLRHRSLQVTAIYAKVDVGLLREVVQPWPVEEVPPC
jgi:site-specific recombinase XerD